MKNKVALIIVFGILIIVKPLGSQTWESTKRLTWNSGASKYPTTATDSHNHIYVVWYDDVPGNYEIYCKKSTNEGSSWTAKRLTWNSAVSAVPVAAVDANDHIHVAWHDGTPGSFEIYYKKSTNGGTTWTMKRLTWNSGSSSNPAIAADSNNHIHVVWHDSAPGNYDIYYKKSTNGGATWTTKRLTWKSSHSWKAAIAVDSNNHIHVVWEDDAHGKSEIYYKKSTNGGTTWTTKRLTWNSGYSWRPVIAADTNNHIHVVWDDTTPGNLEEYYKKSTDGGTTWTTKRLTWNSGTSRNSAIAADSSNHLHVVWEDCTIGYDIYYKRSTDGGSSWTTKRLTYSSGTSEFPTLAVDSSNRIHVVWHDYTPGNHEIFYKKGIQ